MKEQVIVLDWQIGNLQSAIGNQLGLAGWDAAAAMDRGPSGDLYVLDSGAGFGFDANGPQPAVKIWKVSAASGATTVVYNNATMPGLKVNAQGIAVKDDDTITLMPAVAGGPVATHMEPMAIFLDAVLIGDGEEATTEIALSWVEGKRRGLTRAERLRELANIRGVYVPSLYDTVI